MIDPLRLFFTSRSVRPSTDYIELTEEKLKNFELHPGRYKVPHKEDYISVQYDDLVPGDLYEVWWMSIDPEPRRRLSSNQVKQILYDFFYDKLIPMD